MFASLNRESREMLAIMEGHVSKARSGDEDSLCFLREAVAMMADQAGDAVLVDLGGFMVDCIKQNIAGRLNDN